MMRERDKKFESMSIVGLVAVLIAIYEAIICVGRTPMRESRSRAHGELVVNLSEMELVKR